jgi:hypothetical protein
MKPLLLTILVSTFITVTPPAFAQQEKSVALRYVDMKCYTELLGGGFMIHRNYDVPLAQLADYQSSLKELNTPIKKNNQTKVIYRVIECKKVHEKFRHKPAANLDELEKNMG